MRTVAWGLRLAVMAFVVAASVSFAVDCVAHSFGWHPDRSIGGRLGDSVRFGAQWIPFGAVAMSGLAWRRTRG